MFPLGLWMRTIAVLDTETSTNPSVYIFLGANWFVVHIDFLMYLERNQDLKYGTISKICNMVTISAAVNWNSSGTFYQHSTHHEFIFKGFAIFSTRFYFFILKVIQLLNRKSIVWRSSCGILNRINVVYHGSDK